MKLPCQNISLGHTLLKCKSKDDCQSTNNQNREQLLFHAATGVNSCQTETSFPQICKPTGLGSNWTPNTSTFGLRNNS